MDRLDICNGCDNDPGLSIVWYADGTNAEICRYCRRAYTAGIAAQKAKENAELDQMRELPPDGDLMR